MASLTRALGAAVAVSVGACLLDPDEQLDVHAAIRVADARMYEQKRARKAARLPAALDRLREDGA